MNPKENAKRPDPPAYRNGFSPKRSRAQSRVLVAPSHRAKANMPFRRGRQPPLGVLGRRGRARHPVGLRVRDGHGFRGAGRGAWQTTVGALTRAAHLNVLVRIASNAAGVNPALPDMTFT